ncbi:hypothetical protein [Streptomyces sp. NPDC056527]|uniref:hypothetical protein n=1 Tax=Streptomyces sp. NPDC056527 TaxID=3345853 RepID=UPI0036B6A6CE
MAGPSATPTLVGHAVILHRPGLNPVRIGSYENDSRAEGIAAGLRRQLHVEGNVIVTGDFRPDLDHLDPRVPTDLYALAEAMDNGPDGDGTGRNFPDLSARLCAQEPAEYASEQNRGEHS